MSFATSQDHFAQALLHAESPLPVGVTTARGEADAARFAVYRNNVYVGLAKTLAQRFPVTERLLGPEFFAGMARVYAQDNKPVSPLIIEYGEDFPDFIAGFGPAREVPYVPDVARLEAAWTRAYHAADVAPLDLHRLASLPPDVLPHMRLAVHPSATLVSSAHPVGSIWAAHQTTVVTGVTEWRAETVLVVRPDMAVNLHVLPGQDAPFARAIFAGETLAAAAEAALAQDANFDFGAALVGLAALGAFADIHEGDTA